MDRDLLRIIGRTRRRLRCQHALDAATTLAVLTTLAVTVMVYLLKADIVGAGAFWGGVAVALAVPLLAALWGALRRVSIQHVAKRIDTSHDLHDRIGTAAYFSSLPPSERTDFMEAQIHDAVRHAPRVAAARAAPYHWPKDLRLLGLTACCLAFVVLLRFPTERAPVAPRPPVLKLSVDPEDLEPHVALARELQQEALEHEQQEMSDLAKDLNRLFEQIQRKELTRKELFAKLAELERKYLEGMEGNFDDLLKKLKKMGGELQKEKLTKEAGKALEKNDLTKAKKELDKLAKEVDKLKQQEKRRLAKALKQASQQKMGKDQLQRKLDRLNREIRRLQRKLKQQPKDQQTRRRLERKRRQLQRLNRQRQQMAQQRRQLQRLNRQLQQCASCLNNKLSADARKALEEAARQMGRFANQLNKLRMKGKAQGQIVDLKELLRRLGKGKGGKGKLADFFARAKGQKGKGKGKGKGKQALLLDPNGQGGSLIMPLPAQGAPQAGQDSPNGQPGDGIGNSHDPNLMGQSTRLKARRKDVMVRGAEGKGPTRSEVILGASEEGFATQHYRRVYRDYSQIIEEVLKREEVPLGYKYYVKQYFKLIKPR